MRPSVSGSPCSCEALPANDPSSRIQEAAHLALRASGYPDLAKLGCEVQKGVLVLTGFVSSYYLKQVAQETVMRLKLDYGLHNGIVVL